MTEATDNVFMRNWRKVWAIVILVVALTMFAATELVLRKCMGLGNPVLYDSSPVYGFRPLPCTEYRRFHGARIRFNNLGLRAAKDFDGNPGNKILFLGDSVTYGGSYIDDEELFSHLAVKGMGKYESGNAGVNGWGVENIYGLIVESSFLPAEIYVTTLLEADFYRGLTRCQGTPFSNVSPRLALVEVWRQFCYTQNIRRYRKWQTYSNDVQIRYVVEKAAHKLREMDEFLKGKRFRHLIFISPRREQVVNGDRRDPLVEEMLLKYGLHAVYIADKLNECGLSPSDKRKLFHDSLHLEREGHAVWAKIMRRELDGLMSP